MELAEGAVALQGQPGLVLPILNMAWEQRREQSSIAA